MTVRRYKRVPPSQAYRSHILPELEITLGFFCLKLNIEESKNWNPAWFEEIARGPGGARLESCAFVVGFGRNLLNSFEVSP